MKELEQVKAENKQLTAEREVMQNHIKSLEETVKLYMHMSSTNLV